jgi:hypothetical protein
MNELAGIGYSYSLLEVSYCSLVLLFCFLSSENLLFFVDEDSLPLDSIKGSHDIRDEHNA